MLGGLINHSLGRIAKVNDLVDLEGGGRLEVLDMDLHRVIKVRFEFRVTEDQKEVSTEPSQQQVAASVADKRRSYQAALRKIAASLTHITDR